MSDTNWARSSFWRDGDACIEVCRDGGAVRIRDGELGDDSRELVWSVERWVGFLGALTRGEDTVEVLLDDDGGDMWFGARGDDSLLFTAGAWNSFVAGVKAGEFDVEKLSTPPVPVSEGSQVSGEVGPADERPNLAATGAGTGLGGVVPVPVVAQPPQISEPVGFTERGFAVYADFIDSYGKQVRVVESSAALEDHCWIFAGGEAAHLNNEQARTVRDALSAWLANGDEATALEPAMAPEPRWGSGPLVDHNPETPAAPGTGSADPDGGQ